MRRFHMLADAVDDRQHMSGDVLPLIMPEQAAAIDSWNLDKKIEFSARVKI